MGHYYSYCTWSFSDCLHSTPCASAPEQDAPAIHGAFCTNYTALLDIYQCLPNSETFLLDVDTFRRLDGYR